MLSVQFFARLALMPGLFFASSAIGQGFQAGWLAGLNTSQITGDNLAGYNKPSLTAGVWVNRTWNDERWALTMEMAWLPRGARSVLRAEDSIPTLYRLNLRYIEVPLLLSFRVYKKFHFETGIGTGVYINHTEEDEFGDMSGIYGPREQFARFDISFNAGITWKFHEKWSLNVRSANSMFPVRNHDQDTKFRLNQGQYSSSIMARLVYRFQ